MGLLKLISAPVVALVGRAQQQGRSGTAKSAFERRNVWREKCSLNPRNGQPLRPHPTRYGACSGTFMCRFTPPSVLVMLFRVRGEPLRMVRVRFWSTSYFAANTIRTCTVVLYHVLLYRYLSAAVLRMHNVSEYHKLNGNKSSWQCMMSSTSLLVPSLY